MDREYKFSQVGIERKEQKPKFVILVLCLILGLPLSAQNHSLNDQLLKTDSSSQNFSFLVGGHFYGSSKIKNGIPGATILASLESLNQSKAKFLVSLGDVFADIKNDIPKTKEVFIDRLHFPLYNVVGDHDLSNSSDNYAKYFGTTFYTFEYQNALFLFFDTEKEDGSIKGEQLTMLKNALQKSYKQIFIFSHRPIWSEEKEHLKNVFKKNGRSKFGNNYLSEIEPLLLDLPTTTQVQWFSGSLGWAPFSFFYHKENERLHFIQTAIKDRREDGILKVNVENGKVNYETISLTDQKLQPLEYYNIQQWATGHQNKKFNLILFLKNLVLHAFFWYGVLASFVGMLFLFLLGKFFLNKK